MGNKSKRKGKFKRDPKQFLLRWPESEDLAGLEVQMRSLSIERMLELQGLEATIGAEGADTSPETVRNMFRIFAGSMVSWNLEDEFDEDVPATYEYVVKQDLDLIMEVVQEWLKAMSPQVPPPLPGSSNSTGTMPDLPIPMTPLD